MKNLLLALGFSPKENTQDIYSKKYPLCGGYEISVDYKNEKIEYGDKIGGGRATTANFSQDENWVVLECVDRLLSKGYKPEDIFLEKKFTVGHGAAGGWLDIFVKKEGKAYLMIECKTWGKEFDKEWQNTQKKGGQLLSYLQQDRDAEFLVLYASQLENGKVIYRNEIIKVEEDYRQMASNTEDLYNRWNKFSKQNGIFESWARAYHFESKALTLSDLVDIRQEDSSFIFNRFLEILRHNAVSDKPNAFNKIFTLFLCKIKDEDKNPDDELDFQWKEGEDDAVSFQKRLSDLYKKGMEDFLNKEITDISDDDFHKKFGVFITNEDTKRNLLAEFTRIRLQKNNEFAIKEVFDEETFYDNAKVLKEVVELLQSYRFRYAKKQPFLGDFFELLLTTGLKQEAGQFFTPVPIARFISKSVPLEMIMRQKLASGATDELLPNIIDYAAGSGHFLTESMEELQNILSRLDLSKFPPSASRKVKPWQHDDPFAWAHDYIYGVELDYRLVKTTKVGCYLHGDGIANIIHGDGLDSFTDGNYLGKLQKKIPGTQDNGQFDFVLANPPYSVSACKGNLKNKNADKDFELYKYLTDQSSQIESLFIERTKQLLNEGGIAAIVLPSSILSNSGIYTRTREILLKYFEFVAIAELGSGTFMATGTNTVILFLRRRSNADFASIESSILNFFVNHRDINIKINFSRNIVIENAISKYISHVWGNISFDDYILFITGVSSDKITLHEITREYEKKLKSKDKKDWLHQVKELEKDKILHFLLAYGQEIVLVKSGDKQDEKNFLGYEFSNRKGDEGIHSIRRGKLIDECTLLFHPEEVAHPERVNTYILDAFANNYNRIISDNLLKYVSRANLVDMITWDRAEFEKNISLSVKKKIKMESKWEIVKLASVCEINPSKKEISEISEDREASFIEMSSVSNEGYIIFSENRKIKDLKKRGFTYFREDDIILAKITPCMENGKCAIAKHLMNGIGFGSSEFHVFGCQKTKILPEYLFSLLNQEKIRKIAETNMTGTSGHRRVPIEFYEKLDIPLPPLDIQEQIVREMEEVEKREMEMKKRIEKQRGDIAELMRSVNGKDEKLENIAVLLKRGKSAKYGDSRIQIIKSGQARGLKEFDFRERHFIEQGSILDERKLQRGDILINSTGVGTAGRVTLFDLEGDFVVDTHVTILRVDRSKTLPDFVLQSLTKIGFKNIEAMATGQSGQIELSLGIIGNIKIPLPPLSEQQRIVTEIEKIEDEISRLESELTTIPSQKEFILKKYLA